MSTIWTSMHRRRPSAWPRLGSAVPTARNTSVRPEQSALGVLHLFRQSWRLSSRSQLTSMKLGTSNRPMPPSNGDQAAAEAPLALGGPLPIVVGQVVCEFVRLVHFRGGVGCVLATHVMRLRMLGLGPTDVRIWLSSIAGAVVVALSHLDLPALPGRSGRGPLVFAYRDLRVTATPEVRQTLAVPDAHPRPPTAPLAPWPGRPQFVSTMLSPDW